MDDVRSLGLLLVALAGLTACYGHAPMSSARQLEMGEVAVSGQVREPGWFVVPGVAATGQLGFGIGDIGAQTGAGIDNVYGGLMTRLYPMDAITIGIDGTYVWTPESYDRDHYDSITPDFDDSAVLGGEIVIGGAFGSARIYAGPRSQVSFYIPDPARDEYDDLIPATKKTQLAGVTLGGVTGGALEMAENLDFQAELMVLPLGWERTFFYDSRWESRHTFSSTDRRAGDTLQENRFQISLGAVWRF